MAAFWLTFRLHGDKISGSSYEERYDALTTAVDKLSTQWWVEPTSFIAFESTQTIASIAAACKRAVAPTHDLVLIRQMDTQSALLVGQAAGATIYALMPYLKNA
jgi:hypothetical protein